MKQLQKAARYCSCWHLINSLPHSTFTSLPQLPLHHIQHVFLVTVGALATPDMNVWQFLFHSKLFFSEQQVLWPWLTWTTDVCIKLSQNSCLLSSSVTA